MLEKSRIRVSQIFVALVMFVLMISTTAWDVKYPLWSALFFTIGVVLVGIASLGRLWCSLYIAGYKTGTLVTVGPYSMCRNPLYFFSLLGMIGVGLATETLLIPFVILIAFAIYYPGVIKDEEATLKKIHSEEFEAYCLKVPRFFPKISALTEPQEYVVKPIIFKRHMFSALWFIWLIGVTELIEDLHEMEILPNLFRIF
jgi:protein-S-isoprenylcysteine O-methyltransferase Ste14